MKEVIEIKHEDNFVDLRSNEYKGSLTFGFGMICGMLISYLYFRQKIKDMDDLLLLAWYLIADGWEEWSEYYKNTNKRAKEWIESAISWRDKYFKWMKNN